MGNDLKKGASSSIEKSKTTELSMLESMIDKGLEPDQLLKFYKIYELNEANEARKAYAVAMADFQAGCPVIEKTAKGHNCMYAPLPEILSKTKDIRAQCGFSHMWQHGVVDGIISITCVVTHKLGHKESTTLTAGADSSGNKNDIQAIGSTTKYLERYTFEAMFGICADNMDTDGNKLIELIRPKDVQFLKDRIKEVGADLERFLKHQKIDKLENIQVQNFGIAVGVLNAKAKANKK